MIDAGTISVAADTILGAAPGSAVADQLTLSGGTLQTTASFTLNTNRGITLSTDGGGINTDASTTLTYGGVIDGTTAFTKSGDGILALSGANTYTGDTVISAGTLQLGAAAVIANASAVTVNGTLDLNDYNETISDLSGSGTVDLGSATLTTIQYNSTTYSGGMTGTGDLKKKGGGVLTLSGSTDFTGGITIQVGTLQLGANNVIGDTNPITFADTDIFIHKATLDLNDYSDTVGTVTANYTDAKILLGSGGLTINQANGADTNF